MKSIVFTGGGSAGHVVPNMALMDVFLSENVKVFYVGSEEGIERKLIEGMKNIPYYPIACGKLRRYFSLKNFFDPLKILLGIWQSFRYLGKIKPDVVFSKGGFVAFPVVFAAWLRRIAVIAHESDLTPGLANRLSFPFVRKIAFTFPPLPNTSLKSEKIVVTGTPIRQELFHGDAKAGRKRCGFENNNPCVMIIGGGSGATMINDTVRKILPELLKTMNVIHCCGQGKLMENFSEKNSGYKQFEYVNEEMADLYASADLIISRAGANTVYEVLALNKVAIFIPLSRKASRGDQIANANFLKSRGLCSVLEEEHLNPQALLQTIQETINHQKEMQEKIVQYEIQSGTETIVNLIHQITEEVEPWIT